MIFLLLISLIFCQWCVEIIAQQTGFKMADQCKIFCEGPLLHAVQTANIFADSKQFVDMPLRHSPEITLQAFNNLPNKTDSVVLKQFLHEYFREAGTELDSCNPEDFVKYPRNFDKIQDPLYKKWALEIHGKWKTLCRQVKNDVKLNPRRFSLIPVPHPFMAPGGRFREFYYWDSYWIVKGLIASGMYKTAKNMIRNLGDMVKRFGFVPNGGRIYYLHRSQPPLLPLCVETYFEATGDKSFLAEMLPLLEREHDFWQRERAVAYKPGEFSEIYQFYQFRVDAQVPRPESYREDIETAAHASTDSQKKQIYSDIAAACESGWDFSSRWFNRTVPHRATIRDIRTSKIIPVDLNSFICGNQKILAQMHLRLGNASMAQWHEGEHEFFKHAMHKSFWDHQAGSWFDLDLDLNGQSKHFYVSNPTPLFTGCAHNAKDVGRRVWSYLEKSGGTAYPGGLPTSFEWSGQQWDSPNGWAPTNHIVIEGLRKQAELTEDNFLAETAFRLADRWIQTNYFVYLKSGGKMFEKYDVESETSHAGGGVERKTAKDEARRDIEMLYIMRNWCVKVRTTSGDEEELCGKHNALTHVDLNDKIAAINSYDCPTLAKNLMSEVTSSASCKLYMCVDNDFMGECGHIISLVDNHWYEIGGRFANAISSFVIAVYVNDTTVKSPPV